MGAKLVGTIDMDTDSLRFYFLGREWRRRVEHVGAKPATDPDAPLIVQRTPSDRPHPGRFATGPAL